MNWYRNLKIRLKLLTGFSIVIVLVAILSVISVRSTRSVDSAYSYVLDFASKRYETMLRIENVVTELRRSGMGILLYHSDETEMAVFVKGLEDSSKQISSLIDEYLILVENDPVIEQSRKLEMRTSVASIEKAVAGYYSVMVDKVLLYARQGMVEEAFAAGGDTGQYTEAISSAVSDLLTNAAARVEQVSIDTTASVGSSIVIQIIFSVGITLFILVMSVFISNTITRPIQQLADAALSISEGNLNVNINADTKDEVGILAGSFAGVVNNIKSIIADIDLMYHEHDNGDFDSKIDSLKYKGSFKEITNSVNEMVFAYVMIVADVLNLLSAMADGDFNTELRLEYKGKKTDALIKTNKLKGTVRDILLEIDKIAKAGSEGQLSVRADSKKYKGEWVVIIDGLNNVLDTVIKPIEEAAAVMEDMSKGDLSSSVKGDYKGDFAKVKDSINTTMKTIGGYISEITDKLSFIAEGDLTASISREYVGQFSSIKNSINTIGSTLSKTMYEITSSSDQVLQGSKQISDSSMQLAQGAAEQAASVQQLKDSIDTISVQNEINAKNAENANMLSRKSKENAKEGNDDMKKMLESMTRIEESSNNISKIIKVIDNIAFQTNLLALNAAVEAARAGEHGKGFAVVAEEVRSLAMRSQTAARETTGLIEDSINKVKEGASIAQETAETLDKIVENVEAVSNIIYDISKSSKSQTESIENATVGINQISDVVQANSSTSEESAASSEELNSQAEMLKRMISYFKI